MYKVFIKKWDRFERPYLKVVMETNSLYLAERCFEELNEQFKVCSITKNGKVIKLGDANIRSY